MAMPPGADTIELNNIPPVLLWWRNRGDLEPVDRFDAGRNHYNTY